MAKPLPLICAADQGNDAPQCGDKNISSNFSDTVTSSKLGNLVSTIQ